MWKVISVLNPDEQHWLCTGKEYVLGRKDCDIPIPKDQSISRLHAVLNISHPEKNLSFPHKVPILTIKDCSKLGTFVNGKKLAAEIQQPLKSSDELTLGTIGTKFVLSYTPFVVTTSCLDNSNKKLCKTIALQLGGHHLSEWRKECDVLVMSSLSVTIKVICALVSLKPIVTPQYLQELLDARQNNCQDPNPELYIPPLAESQLDPTEVSFKKKDARKELFVGKQFIFLSTKQFKKLSLAVELAGGIPVLMEEGSDDNDDDFLVGPGTCVMQCDPNDNTQNLSQNAQEWIRHVKSFLKKHKKRLLMDAELGYAVLYCSTEKYCNPDSDSGNLFQSMPTERLFAIPQSFSEQPDVLVTETEVTPERLEKEKRMKINKSSGVQKVLESPEDSKRKEEIKEEEVDEKEKLVPVSSCFGRKRPRESDQECDKPNGKQMKRDPFSFHGDMPRVTDSDKSTKPQRVMKSESIEAENSSSEDNVDEFDAVCFTKRGSNKKLETANHGNNSAESGSRKGTRVVKCTDSPKTSSDLFHSHRSSRQQRQSPCLEQPSSIMDIATPVESKSRSPSPKPSTSRQAKNKASKQSASQTPVSSKCSSSPVATRLSPRQKPITSDTDRNDNLVSATKHVSTNEEAVQNIRVHSSTLGDVPAGYLTTMKPLRDQVSPDNHYEFEKDLPSAVVLTELKSLVVRQTDTRCRARQQNEQPTWNGKTVKNFKKFKKVPTVGANQLPRIIGGRDLEAHKNATKKDLDNWFSQALEAESQQNEIDRMAREMFDWDPQRKRKR